MFVDPTPNTNANFGRHLDIDGDLKAIAAQNDGEVHIFDATSGSHLQTLAEGAPVVLFGRSVDLDDGHLLVGSAFGAAYLYSLGDNQAPTADAGLDRIAIAGTAVSLDGSGSSDPENDPLEFRLGVWRGPLGERCCDLGCGYGVTWLRTGSFGSLRGHIDCQRRRRPKRARDVRAQAPLPHDALLLGTQLRALVEAEAPVVEKL